MDRKDFFKNGLSFMGMGLLANTVLAQSLDKTSSCTVANTETAGPFPTITPSSLVMSNIVGDRTGVAFTINIHVKNVNNNCQPVQGLIVDIWHCDKDGNYSEYGGTPMQQTDYTNKHFLRGRQTSDANGLVSFTSIFPGWYQSRATHIHVHLYTAIGQSVLISQIAFPEGSNSAVVQVNAATSYGYTKGMNGYTYNASDNVFSDGTSTEMSTVTGSVAAGFVLNWDAYVNTAVTAINEVSPDSQFEIRQNFPNPATTTTKIPIVLKSSSNVKVTVFNLQGQIVGLQDAGMLHAGENTIDLYVGQLAVGSYLMSIKIINTQGTFTQSKMLLKM